MPFSALAFSQTALKRHARNSLSSKGLRRDCQNGVPLRVPFSAFTFPHFMGIWEIEVLKNGEIMTARAVLLLYSLSFYFNLLNLQVLHYKSVEL